MKNLIIIRRLFTATLLSIITSFLLISCANKPSIIVVHESAQEAMQNLVHGKLVDNDDNMPIAGATVFVPKAVLDEKKPLADLSLNSALEQSMGCKTPSEPYLSFACTDQFGNFTITLTNTSQENLSIKFQYDQTTIHTDLSLNDLDSDIGTIVFTSNNLADEKKKIAIVLDFQAQNSQMSNSSFANALPQTLKVEFEQEFTKMYEIDENEYDVEFMPFTSLFEDKDEDSNLDIFNYKIIYLITPGNEDLSDLSKDNKLTLLDFISKGGELFVTTLSVEADEPSLEEFI